MPASNNTFQRDANIALVAQLIWKNEGISRVDISRILKLNKSTVSNIISVLMESGLVVEGDRKDSNVQGGRKAIELTISKSFGCVIGVDLQTSHYRTVIMSVDGTILWQKKGTRTQISFEKFLCFVVDEALEAHQNYNSPVLALSFSISGLVDSKTGTVVFSHPFKLRDYHMVDFLKARYNYPIHVENDANCAAWVDLHENLGSSFASNALAVVADFHEESKRNDSVIGIGIGLGVIIDGAVYRGSHSAAGEFCSLSWTPGNPNQSGLSLEVLRNTLDDKNSLTQWMRDTFLSFIPLFSVMDFENVILHGNPFADEAWVLETLKENVPEFMGILDRVGCKLLFQSQDEYVSAKGAALKYLHELYSIPELEKESPDRWTWYDIFEYLEKQQ